MWIFPIGQGGEASWWRVCYQRGLPRLVLETVKPKSYYLLSETSLMRSRPCPKAPLVMKQLLPPIPLIQNRPAAQAAGADPSQ